MGQRIDYSKVKKEYMTSKKSLTYLADKYGISKTQLYKKAREDGWEQKRNAIAEKHTDSVIDRVMEIQNDAWEETKTAMLRILKKKIEVLENNPSESDMTYGQMAHTIKEMRDAGMFGVTPSEKKINTEIEKLKKEIADDGSKDVTLKVITADLDDYAD